MSALEATARLNEDLEPLFAEAREVGLYFHVQLINDENRRDCFSLVREAVGWFPWNEGWDRTPASALHSFRLIIRERIAAKRGIEAPRRAFRSP